MGGGGWRMYKTYRLKLWQCGLNLRAHKRTLTLMAVYGWLCTRPAAQVHASCLSEDSIFFNIRHHMVCVCRLAIKIRLYSNRVIFSVSPHLTLFSVRYYFICVKFYLSRRRVKTWKLKCNYFLFWDCAAIKSTVLCDYFILFCGCNISICQIIESYQ